MRRFALIAALLFAPFAYGSASAQDNDALCANPATYCGGLIAPACLNRVGAGALPAGDACGAQFAAYKSCLTTAAQTCGGAANAPPAAPVSREKVSSSRIFLLEEDLEGVYANFWHAVPLRTRDEIAQLNGAEMTIIGEGKTVDFYGVLHINCENKKFHWKSASNFGEALNRARSIEQSVPNAVVTNATRAFCP